MSLKLKVTEDAWYTTSEVDLLKTIETTITYDDTDDATEFLELIFGESIPIFDQNLVRTSPIYDLSIVDNANTSTVVWDSTTPSGTSILVEANMTLDGVTWNGWEEIKNNTNLSDIHGNLVDLSNAKIQFRQTLSTESIDITPELKSFGVKFHDASQLRVKEEWQLDTRLLAKFLGDLEAGNINNSGIQIVEFAVKRRRVDELKYTTLDKIPFVNNQKVEYLDNTQPNDQLIYSIVPIGENGLEGKTNDVQIESDFVGWWIIDKDDIENTIKLDTYISGSGQEQINTTLNQGRVSLETMNKYPQIYYNEQEYHSMTLSATIIPSEWERSNKDYKRILQAITSRKPMIVKGSNGSIFVCDVYAPKAASLVNSTKTYDWLNITLEAVEVEDYNVFMEEGKEV